MREIVTPKGSRFLLCQLAQTDSNHPKYSTAARGPVRGLPEEGTARRNRGAMKQQDKARCPWAKTELYVQYHDTEWGVPVHDDRLLFEFLILEGAQVGLSWETVLKKREDYREAFDQFDPAVVANYDEKKRQSLLSNPGIIRNRLKIEAAVQNAKAFLAMQDDIGTFDKYVWGFVGNEPKQNTWRSIKEVPAKTLESDAMSKDLKRRGFTFVGSTICYAFMQAVGMVNDHLVDCFRHGELRKSGRARP